MQINLTQWWSQRPYDNEEEKRVAYLVFVINLFVLIDYGIVMLISLYWDDWTTIAFCGIASVLQTATLWLIAHGKLQAGNFFNALIVLSVVTAAATAGQGIHDLAMTAYPVVLIIASLLSNRLRGVIIFVLTLGSIGWLVFGDAYGWYVTSPFLTPNSADFLIVASILSTAFIAIELLSSNLRQGLTQAHKDIAERQRAEAALRESEQTSRRMAQQLQVVHQISAIIASGLDLEQLLLNLYQQCQQIGDTDTFFVALYDEITGILTFPFYFKDGNRRTPPTRNIKENPGLSGHIIEHRQTLYLPDSPTTSSGLTVIREPGALTRSFIGIPLMLHDHIVGVFSMQSHAANAYTPYQISTLEMLATQVAIALKNSQLYAQSQREIAERKHAERALRDSEERFRSLYENTAIGIYRTTPEGRILMANPALISMLGYDTFEELAQRDLSQTGFYPDHPRQDFQQRIEQDGIALGIESKWVCKDGAMIYVRESARLVVDEGGKPLYYDGTAEDITERKRTDEALRESEERFRSTFEQAAVGIAHVALDGRFLRINQRFCDIVGYSQAEVLARSFQDITYPDDLEADLVKLNELLSQQIGNYMLEKRYIRKEGSLIWVNLTVALVHESTGAPKYFISVVEDISQRKQTEAELAQYRLHLEEMVTERTAALTRVNQQLETEIIERKRIEEALRQAKEAAEFANLAKTNFLRSMSHELRTPLNHILGFAQLLQRQRRDTLSPQQETYVNTILSSSAHLLSLIEDILMLSQLDFGKRELHRMTIPLKPLLENSLKNIREKDLKQLDLAINLPHELEHAAIVADQETLKQILFQLLSNAVKFTPDGGEILLDAERNGPEIVISVRDTGIGIAPEQQVKLFEPFYQVQGELVSKTPGTGLGLTIARRLIELHGGKLWVFSAGKGKGSYFSFSIPQAAVSPADDPLRSRVRSSAPPHTNAALPAGQSAEQPAARLTLDHAALSELPSDVQEAFHEAVNYVDIELAHTTLARIRLHNAPLADALAELVEAYRFDTLLALFQEPG